MLRTISVSDVPSDNSVKYGYTPSIIMSGIFLAIFSFSTVLHIYQSFSQTRYKFMSLMAFAGASKSRATLTVSRGLLLTFGLKVELLGWSGRVWSRYDWFGPGNIVQICCLVIAPSFMSAALYVLFGLVMSRVAQAKSYLSSKLFRVLFITADVLCLVLQGAGGGFATTAETIPLRLAGSNVMLAGIVIQLSVMVVFVSYGALWAWRAKKEIGAGGRDLHWLLFGILFSSLMIIIRGFYRSVELGGGIMGFLATNQLTFLLDAIPISIATLAVKTPRTSLCLSLSEMSEGGEGFRAAAESSAKGKKGKRAQAAAGSDDDEPQGGDEDPEDISDPEPAESEEEESEDEFKAAPKKKKRASQAASGASKAKTGAGASPKKPAGAKKRAPKKKNADATSGDEGEERARAPAAGKLDVVIEEDNTLFNAVRDPNSSLQTVVDDWIESYQEASGPAMAELINFILRTCGCNATIDEHQAEDENGIVDCLADIQDEFKNVTLLAYPLVSKSKALKKFRASLTTFLSRLFTSCATSEILYDDTFCQTFQSWLTSLSSSKIRSFRHTATVMSLITVSALCEVSVLVNKNFAQASRAEEAEIKKGRKDKARLKDLSTNVKEIHSKKTQLEAYLDELFEGVFVHRYRDFESIIRAECIKALGQWMKIHPDYWLEGNYLRYHGWVLSDDHKDVRHEAVKALISLYAKEDHIGAMQHFTDRFKGQLVRMAVGEVDLSVRIACIHVLRQIDKHGLLEDSQRDEVATLVFESERRVRQAVAGFFQGLQDELVQERETELDAVTGEREAQLKDQLKLKCLAELLVKYGRALDGIDEDAADEDDELDAAAAAAIVQVTSHRGRVAFAVEALWDQVEVLRDWQGIMDFLLLDHSADAQGDTPKAKGKGRKGKGKAANGAAADEVDPACRLTEDEETLLVEVLVASLTKATGSTGSTKKEKEKDDETMSEISRAVIDALRRLFAKHQTVPTRVVDLLAIPTLISLDLYLELRMVTAHEGLWDDVTKQFNKHADVRVIDQAVQTISTMNAAKTLGQTNTAKMGELEDTLVSALRECVSGKDVESAAFEEDELLVLTSAVLRISRLYASYDLSKSINDAEDGKSRAWDVIDSLVERGRLGYKDEVAVVEHAIGILGADLIWSIGRLVETSDADFDVVALADVVDRRNALVDKLEELSVGTNANAGETVKQAALVLLLDIHIVCASLPEDPNGRLADLETECSDELQARCAGFVEAQVERYSETVAENADPEEEEAVEIEEDEAEDSDDDAAEKRRKKKDNAKRADARKAHGKNKDKAAPAKTPAAIRAANLKKEARLVAAGLFHRTVSAFVRAVHKGVVSLQHASVILIHFERFDTTLDQWCKLLVQDMRDEGIYGDSGALVSRVIVDTLKGATEIFLDAIDPSEDRLVAVSRVLSGAVVVRGAQLALVKRLRTSDHVQLHTDALAYIIKRYAVLRDAKKKDASTRVLGFFKALGNLLIGLDGQGALKVKTSMDTLLEANEIVVLASAKAWEPVRGYQKRLATAMSKDPTIKIAPAKKAKRAAAGSGDEDDEDEPAASSSPKAKAKPRPRAPRITKKAKVAAAASDHDSDQDSDVPEVLPTRKRRGPAPDSPAKSANGAGSPKKRKVSPKKKAGSPASDQESVDDDEPANEAEPANDEEPATDEDEEMVASQLIPSSQVKAKWPHPEEEEEVEEVEEEEEEVEEDEAVVVRSPVKGKPRPPASVASQASLSDVKRKASAGEGAYPARVRTLLCPQPHATSLDTAEWSFFRTLGEARIGIDRPSLSLRHRLRDLLAPVVRYVLSVFAQRNPRYLLRIVNRHDEFFGLVMFFVERHYLKTWGASFAENFYGLKRRRVLGTGSDKTKAAVELTGRSEKLGTREIRASLVALILIPYARSKAQDLYERLGGGVDSDLIRDSPAAQQHLLETPPLRERLSNALKSAFKATYPYANVGYELYLLAYNIGYLFEKTPYWRPWLSWMKVEVRRMSAEDYRAAQNATQSLLSSPLRRHSHTGLNPSYPTIALRSLALIPRLSFEALKFLLPTSIFFFRFLEWWYSSEGGYGRLRKKGAGGEGGKALRAPPRAGGVKPGREPPAKGMCAVHGGEMVNPTALPTGWLACYKCLHAWVEEHGDCPVSGVKVELGDLRKIMG
ncbi:hypothetical protein RQP46_000596 [Phenoliferia psychrophenolica]